MELEGEWGAAAVPEPDLKPPAPWEDLGLSLPVGFFRTLRDLLVSPGEFFQNLGRREGWAEPLAFALIVSSAGLAGALFWQLLILTPAGLKAEETLRLFQGLNLGAGGLLAMMAGAPVLVLLDLGVSGLCWWGGVALIGADRDFVPAWRIFCYAHGGMALGLMPFFGLFLSGLWVLALMYCGVKQVYGVSGWRALNALAIYFSLQAFLGLLLVAALALGGFLLWWG